VVACGAQPEGSAVKPEFIAWVGLLRAHGEQSGLYADGVT